MNKTQEALKLAIEAMTMYQVKLDSDYINEAIDACKFALAGQQKPLSDDEIFAICPFKGTEQEDGSFVGEEEFYRGFRDAEKAYGIGE